MKRILVVLFVVALSSLSAAAQVNPAPGQITLAPPPPQGLVSDSRADAAKQPNLKDMMAHMGHTCVEDYLWKDTAHGGTDYGAALNAIDAAMPKDTPSNIQICATGAHAVYTPVIFDRPIRLVGTGSHLIPQSTLQGTRITLTGARVTTGCVFGASTPCLTVQVPSTSGLAVGMRIGGVGMRTANYISSIADGTHFTIQLPAQHTFNGKVTVGSNQITYVTDMKSLAPGVTLSWQGPTAGSNAAPIPISSIDYSKAAITLGGTAQSAGNNPTAIKTTGPITSTLTACTATPVLRWIVNSTALRNSEGQAINSGMVDVQIVDPSWPKGRSLSCVQGAQISGQDDFVSQNFRVDNLAGTCLVIGGSGMYTNGTLTDNQPVRESHFYSTKCRDSGDMLTGQAEIEIMTPPEHARYFDENNQLGFFGGQGAFADGVTLVIGTYTLAEVPYSGPRNIWFQNNFQLESGAHTYLNMNSASDIVELQNTHYLWFDGGEINGPGFGHVAVNCYWCSNVFISHSLIQVSSKRSVFNVRATRGSPTLGFVSGPRPNVTQFDTSGKWDSVGVQLVDGASCTTASPCLAWIAPSGAVAGGGATLKLAANTPTATCNSNSPCQMTIGFGGFASWQFSGGHSTPASNFYADMNAYGSVDTSAPFYGERWGVDPILPGYFIVPPFRFDNNGAYFWSNSPRTPGN